MVHVMAVSKPSSMPIHASRQAQVASLVSEEANIPVEYSDFSDVFSPDSAAELPEHTGFNDHPIDLVDGKQPPYGPIYSLGPMELETLKTYIETNLASGFIRPSQSPAGAPILFIRKKDGSLRLCVDYRGLNTLTIKNRYPLPLIGESLDRLGRAKRFTQLDLTNAYHRMRIREGDEWKTAFRTRYGHFEYQVMPFGLSNAPASFQGYINKILAEKLDVFVIVYLDDILIYTEDVGQGHVEAVKWVLENLRKNGLFANLKKCRFHQDEVRFLGYVVSGQGIRMEEERIEAVTNWPEPKSVRDVQVFMGFANFYRRFIRGFSKIAAPLTSMLKTNLVANTGPSPKARRGAEESCFLTPAAKIAFAQLKQAFTEAPILRHFDPERHIRLETDASGYAIGGVLSQLDIETGQWHPVAYFSRKMIPAETRYETHDGELLAIVEAFKNWRHYLEGCKHEVLVLTDHNNLRRFMDTKSLSPRQVRWAQELSRYNFRIDYRQGKANGAADALSRYPQRSQGEEEVLRAENTRILHRLQSSLTSASISGITSTQHLTPPHHIIICGTHVFPQLRQFWDTLRQDLTSEGPYKVSIGGMRLRLQELQEEDTQAQMIRAEKLGKDGWEDTDGILHYQSKPTSWSFQSGGASMMSFMYHCWSRTPQGRGGWTRRSRSSWNLKLVTMRSTRLKAFWIARFTPRSQKLATYQASTIWSPGRAIQRMKVRGNRRQRSNTYGRSSKPTMRVTPPSRQQPLLLSTPHRQWLSRPLSLKPRGNAAEQLPALGARRRRSRSLGVSFLPLAMESRIGFPFVFPLSYQGLRVFHRS